jgi:hypothetical protein
MLRKLCAWFCSLEDYPNYSRYRPFESPNVEFDLAKDFARLLNDSYILNGLNFWKYLSGVGIIL